MSIDFSDVDNLNKLKCLACLPEEANKEALWNQYLKKEISQQEFIYSSSCFYNSANEE